MTIDEFKSLGYDKLSKESQELFNIAINKYHIPYNWGIVALTANSLYNWEQFGFGCFSTLQTSSKWFKIKVDKIINENTIEIPIDPNQKLVDLKNTLFQAIGIINEIIGDKSNLVEE